MNGRDTFLLTLYHRTGQRSQILCFWETEVLHRIFKWILRQAMFCLVHSGGQSVKAIQRTTKLCVLVGQTVVQVLYKRRKEDVVALINEPTGSVHGHDGSGNIVFVEHHRCLATSSGSLYSRSRQQYHAHLSRLVMESPHRSGDCESTHTVAERELPFAPVTTAEYYSHRGPGR